MLLIVLSLKMAIYLHGALGRAFLHHIAVVAGKTSRQGKVTKFRTGDKNFPQQIFPDNVF